VYNATGMLCGVINERGYTTAYTYNEKGYLTKITNPLGKAVFEASYDQLGSILSYADGEKSKSQISYEGMDATLTDAEGNRNVYTHDSKMRHIKIRYADTKEVTKEYEQDGSLLSETDKEGKKTGKEAYFIDLDPQFSMCFQFDDFGIPYFVGVFEDLVELVDYKLLEKDKTKMDLKKLVVQKLPLDEKTGEVLIELPEAQALHANLIKMLQNNDYIDGISSPCPIDALNLQDNSSKTQRDSLATAERTLFNDAGISQSILNATGNLSLKISVESDEAIMFILLGMYKRWLDNKLNYMVSVSTCFFEVFLPEVTIYNRQEVVDRFLAQAQHGYSKLLPPICSGIKQSTLINMINFEQDYLKIMDKLIPLSSSYTTSNKGGRPQSSEIELDDAGVDTKNRGSNDGRA
jgi:YD repeat-containing protein